jgi:hypothetical protein
VNPGPRRQLTRGITYVVLAIAASLALAACGDDSDESSVQKLTFTLQGSGKESSFTGPKSANTGPVEITLVNGGKKEDELQLLRVEGKQSDQEVADALKSAIEGKPFSPWFYAAGGVGPVPAGDLGTVTQVLEPGIYYPFNSQAGTVTPKFVVEGEESDEELTADTSVTAIDYGFETENLPTGRTEIAFENAGEQPHHLLAAPLLGDSTAEDAEAFFKDEKGKAPLDEKEIQSTTVIEGGESQLVTLDLEPGRYVLYCFVSDREGGPPHAFKGMVDEVEVE